MGKRKQGAPQFADQAKRQQLQWSMTDQFGSSGSQSLIYDGALRNENLNQPEPASNSSLLATSGGESTSGTCTPVHALCVDAFYQNLASCHSTLTLHNRDFVEAKEKTHLLEFGHFKVTLAAQQQLIPLPEQLPEFRECWLYLADIDNPSMLYFETGDNNENIIQQKRTLSRQTKFGVFWFVSLNVPIALLTNLKSKLFLLLCSEFDAHRKSFTVTIFGKEGVVLQSVHPSEAVRIKMPQIALQKLMEYYYDIMLPYNYEGREKTTGHDFFHLYECVMSIHKDRLSTDTRWSSEVEQIHHECLKPVLRHYQKESVAWMLRQERSSVAGRDHDELHPLYCEVRFRDGSTFYYNKHAGSLIRNRPKAIPALPGGILADEMGLGKTVEVLCCMLLHPRADVELPDELPIIEDFQSDSNGNSRSPDYTDSASGGQSQKKTPAEVTEVAGDKEECDQMGGDKAECDQMGVDKEECSQIEDNKEMCNLMEDNKEVGDQMEDNTEECAQMADITQVCDKTGKDSDLISTSKEFTMQSLEPTNTNVNVPKQVNMTEVFNLTGNVAQTMNQYRNEYREMNSVSSEKSVKAEEKVLPQEVYSLSLSSSIRRSNVQEDIVFLSSKETVDLTDDSSAELTTPTLHAVTSTNGHNGKHSESSLDNSMNSTQRRLRTSTLKSDCKTSGNKVIIKINANKKATVVVERGGSASTMASEPSNIIYNTSSLNITSLPSSQVTSSAEAGIPPLSSSPHMTPSHDSSTEGHALQRKRDKRKSKGYVEYVPITDEDTSYFTSKPVAQKQYFECNCGQLDSEEETRRKGLITVKCNLCGMSQHAECMNYDLKDPFRGDYRCPHCHAVSTTIKSGATLIISPYSICHQWIEEISKHIKERSIRVFIYTGVSKLGYIQPQTLAQQDIVITTYDVLRKEVDYVNLPHTNSESGRRFRHPKRFLATPSPMVAVEWWRICLDEAQMVECVTTKTAEMALKLKAVNRWCVTGTPLMRSVEDIYGLLLFLGVDPLLVQQWFRLLLWEPFCYGFPAAMHHALSQVLWRTAKKDVIDQIDLPGQTEEINWLTFSPVEEHFYRRQYELYLRNANANRKKAQYAPEPNTKLHALDRKTMNELLSPLFRLRQACCHPQIVRGEFLPLNKSMMTMEELLDHMTKKVKTECEEAHRQIVFSLNGTAGLAILRGKMGLAVDKYRDVLRSVEEHKNQFRTDDLQQLHAMHNLAELLDKKPKGVSPTLRDSSLKEQCEELKQKYMSRTKVNVTASQEALEATQSVIKDLSRKLALLDGDWWADVIDMTVQRAIDYELVYKIKDDLVRTSTTEGTIADIFSDANGLMYVVDSHIQTLTRARQTLISELDTVAKDTSASLVQKAALCCLRPIAEILKTCPFCKIDELFNEYESKLFLFVERGITVTGDDSNLAYQVSTKRQGTWADSEVERTIKSILAFYRLHFDTDRDILEAATLQIKHLETLKKEFKNLRSLWLSHREMISAIDELEMATERIRLRSEFEPESVTKILNVIEERDMAQQELKCSSDEIVGRDELRRKLGQLVYLTNLAKKNQDGQESNPDTCPICQCGLGVEWSVLMCGHCYCLSCIRALIDRNLIGGNLIERRLKCPVCRHMTPVREISYVTTQKTEKVDVKGSHSTKVQAVIQCLLKIRQQEPTAKALVFSVWVSVLDILAAALAENNIPYKSLHDPNYFQKNLSAFKSEESIQVLLLPLHTGANGLNLVEANHVLLVEPELNLEEEAQAISRISRIGQTRQTKIHRFLVRGTIEEKIFHMVKTLRDSRSGQESDDESLELTVGHITSLLQQPGPDDGEDEAASMVDNVSTNDVRVVQGTGAGDSDLVAGTSQASYSGRAVVVSDRVGSNIPSRNAVSRVGNDSNIPDRRSMLRMGDDSNIPSGSTELRVGDDENTSDQSTMLRVGGHSNIAEETTEQRVGADSNISDESTMPRVGADSNISDESTMPRVGADSNISDESTMPRVGADSNISDESTMPRVGADSNISDESTMPRVGADSNISDESTMPRVGADSNISDESTMPRVGADSNISDESTMPRVGADSNISDESTMPRVGADSNISDESTMPRVGADSNISDESTMPRVGAYSDISDESTMPRVRDDSNDRNEHCS